MSDERLRRLERRARDEDEARWELALELARRGLRGPEDPRPGDVIGSWKQDPEAERPQRVRWVEAIQARTFYEAIPPRTFKGRKARAVGKRARRADHVLVRDYLGEGRWGKAAPIRLTNWRGWLRAARPVRLLQAREI